MDTREKLSEAGRRQYDRTADLLGPVGAESLADLAEHIWRAAEDATRSVRRARCADGCGLIAWRGKGSPLLQAEDIRHRARQHVSETGHSVVVETVFRAVYQPKQEGDPR